MKGAWAGEIGQTQFLASNYLKYAVDFDGDGRRDLIHSKADALASTANFLVAYGWRAGRGYQPGQTNYPAIKEWNYAKVYQRALATIAKRIDSQDQKTSTMSTTAASPDQRPRLFFDRL
jgi:membrane-bound lytic murein transglycosylase B